MEERLVGSEYFAGFFDGEGCVDIAYTKPSSKTSKFGGYALRVTVANTVELPLKMLSSMYGGSIYIHAGNQKHQTQYQWTLTGRKAAKFLVSIEPYVVVKLEQIKVALEFFRECCGYHGPFRMLTEGEGLVRHHYYLKLKSLKKPGLGGLARGEP